MAQVLIQTHPCPCCRGKGYFHARMGRQSEVVDCSICVGTGWATDKAIENWHKNKNMPIREDKYDKY